MKPVSFHTFRPKPVDNAFIDPRERSKDMKSRRTRLRNRMHTGRGQQMTREELIESLIEAFKAKKRVQNPPMPKDPAYRKQLAKVTAQAVAKEKGMSISKKALRWLDRNLINQR